MKGTLIVNNLNETATLYVYNYTVLKGDFENEQQKILPVFVNDLRFWNQLLKTGSSTNENAVDRNERNARFNKRSTDNDRLNDRSTDRLSERQSSSRSKYIQTFKKYTFILFGRTQINSLNEQISQKLTLFFPLSNKLPYLKRLYYKKIRSNRVNCDEQQTNTKSNLESILYFENNQFNTSGIDVL